MLENFLVLFQILEFSRGTAPRQIILIVVHQILLQIVRRATPTELGHCHVGCHVKVGQAKGKVALAQGVAVVMLNLVRILFASNLGTRFHQIIVRNQLGGTTIENALLRGRLWLRQGRTQEAGHVLRIGERHQLAAVARNGDRQIAHEAVKKVVSVECMRKMVG